MSEINFLKRKFPYDVEDLLESRKRSQSFLKPKIKERYVGISDSELNQFLSDRFQRGVQQLIEYYIRHLLDYRVTDFLENFEQDFKRLKGNSFFVSRKHFRNKFKESVELSFMKLFRSKNFYPKKQAKLDDLFLSLQGIFDIVYTWNIGQRDDGGDKKRAKTEIPLYKEEIKAEFYGILYPIEDVLEAKFGRSYLEQFREFLRDNVLVHADIVGALRGSKPRKAESIQDSIDRKLDVETFLTSYRRAKKAAHRN